MVEGVAQAKGLGSLCKELGFESLGLAISVHTDSSAAKSFVSRRGLGKMKHLEIRDLWLQKEVNDGKVVVKKVVGTENPADLMTKILTKKEILTRLGSMSVVVNDGRWVTQGIASIGECGGVLSGSVDYAAKWVHGQLGLREMVCNLSKQIEVLKGQISGSRRRCRSR